MPLNLSQQAFLLRHIFLSCTPKGGGINKGNLGLFPGKQLCNGAGYAFSGVHT
jgi:hypothetical protein